AREHVADFVMKGGGVFGRLEVTVVPAPMRPAPGQSFEDLARIALSTENRFSLRSGQDLPVRPDLGHAGFTEIFLRQNIDGQLRPPFRNLDVVQLEDRGPVRVADFRRPLHELHPLVRALPAPREFPFDSHDIPPWKAADEGGPDRLCLTRTSKPSGWKTDCPIQ